MFGDSNLPAIFTTGLLTGGLTCVAVQGGLLTTVLVGDEQKEKELKINTRPILAFIIAKLFAYTILGFFLGWLGSIIQFSVQTRIIIQFIVVAFLLGTAFSLLRLHPIFDYFVLTPSRSMTHLAYKNSEEKGVHAAAMLGLLTVFIPCGATQAMMALAVSAGNSYQGALIMFFFVLGTSPIFFLLGLATLSLKSAFNRYFVKIAAFTIILLALFNLDATLALSNSPITIRSAINRAYCVVGYCDPVRTIDPVTEQVITFTTTGYSPNYFVVRKGSNVKLHLVNQNATGCIQSFTISSLNIQKIVLPNSSEDITFTAPGKEGIVRFTCSAGFYPGTIEVI